MKKLLFMGADFGTRDLIKCAKRRGIYTIVTDNLAAEKSPAKLMSDEYWMISTRDVDAIEARCREEHIDAVLCAVSEFNADMAMSLCKRLGLPFYTTEEAWRYSRDKRAFKDLCKRCSVPHATDYYVSNPPTEEELNQIQFPVVIKPVDQGGNRGISFCDNKEQLLVACELARSMSNSETLIVERQLKGNMYGAVYMLNGGVPHFLFLITQRSQKGYPDNCYAVGMMDVNHLDLYLREVHPCFLEVIRQSGCLEGLLWVQMILDEDGHFYVFEMGNRMPGNMLPRPLRNVTGFDTCDWMLDLAVGEKHSDVQIPSTLNPLSGREIGVYILWSQKSGIISRIEGVEQIKQIPNIHLEVEDSLYLGKAVVPYQYLLVITFDTANCEEMCQVIQTINDTVKIFDENGEDIVIRYDDFDALREVRKEPEQCGEV